MKFIKLVDDVGRVLAAWVVGLTIEHVWIALAHREEFAGAWELWPARTAAAPLFVGAALFAAALCVSVERLLRRSDRRAAYATSAVAGAVVGWGTGTGRHFASPFARAGLAIFVGVAAIGAVYMYLRARRSRPAMTMVALAVVALFAWWSDGHVLVRLYPAFHFGLFALALGCSALVAIESRIIGSMVARALVVASIGCALYAPYAARRLRSYDNLRRILVESAPWMGRAVRLAAILAPPSITNDVAAGPENVARALDWSDLDVVLVSIDALRADHVGAYGYARPTTPHIDALAREGTLFRHAYCPTPHTSYSVTSMMTGKYLRPLLTLGLGADSETLASDLRRYGYRTAAFYPPAVFFIDQAKFTSFEERALDFEYRKVEFADPALRESQVRAYLASAPTDKPMFLWVHFFEPHEPYEKHAGHDFGDAEIDAYDSEIAEADDGVDRVVRAVRERRPNAIVIVTADHGEEFGDHGGRYHGTTVYEEQVRVPLVVVGRGVRAGVAIDVPVQTIDLVPTILSALGIPRPARARGRDLGALLAHDAAPSDAGFAFAETDDFSLLAERSSRLVCQKQIDACALFDVDHDSGEKHDVSRDRAAEVEAMRRELGAIERSHGRFEGQGADLPDALRRGAAGDVAAAEEVAGLLDDVNVTYRREAARVLFDLKSPKVIAQLARATKSETDEQTRGTCAAALVRLDPSFDSARARELLASPLVDVQRRAALALAERGDASGVAPLIAWLGEHDVEFSRAREIAAALGKCKARAAVPVMLGLLGDVRLRGDIADALGNIGDASAKTALLGRFATEHYVNVRPREASALIALGAGGEIATPLANFAGLPDPMRGALSFARAARLLDAAHSGALHGDATLDAPSPGPLRLGVLLDHPGAITLTVDGVPLATKPSDDDREVWADVPVHGAKVEVRATAADAAVAGLWLVAKSTEAW